MSLPWSREGVCLVAGMSLETACLGPSPADAPTWVLLHEGLGCIALWRDFPQRLVDATGWGALVFSRGGYGQSEAVPLPRPLDYMTREATDVLPDVLDQFGIRWAVTLGHSDGATIAAVHGGLVSSAATPSTSSSILKGIALMAPHFFTEPMGLRAIRDARTAYNDGELRERLARYHANVDNAFRGWNDAWLHPDFEAWNVSDSLDTIRVPVLALQGHQDQYGTRRQIDIIRERCPAPVETHLLDDCRHSPHLEQGDTVLEHLVRWSHSLRA